MRGTHDKDLHDLVDMAHGNVLRAAEEGDTEAFIASVGRHDEPIVRTLEGVRPQRTSATAGLEGTE